MSHPVSLACMGTACTAIHLELRTLGPVTIAIWGQAQRAHHPRHGPTLYHARHGPTLWGNVCPARTRRATFLLTIPTSAPDLPSHGEAPQVDHVALHTFPTKYYIIKQYLGIQQLQLSSVLYLTNNIGPTSVGVNTFSTIMLLTLITNCDGGALVATQDTHFCLIFCLILCGGRVALVSPNMRRDMLPWSATKRGFGDRPGFLNSTGRLGPKRGRKCYVTPAFSGVPNKGDKIRSQNLR